MTHTGTPNFEKKSWIPGFAGHDGGGASVKGLLYDKIIGGLLEQSLDTASVDATGWHDHGHGEGSVHGHFVKWLTFKDLEARVTEDVQRIRSHPLVAKDIPISGYVYDVRSGRLVEVPAATAAGKTVE